MPCCRLAISTFNTTQNFVCMSFITEDRGQWRRTEKREQKTKDGGQRTKDKFKGKIPVFKLQVDVPH